MNRRDFLKTSTLAAATTPKFAPIQESMDAKLQMVEKPMLAIQIPAVSFVDEGTEKVLDNVEKLGVNTIFITVFAFVNGLAGRQLKGNAFPDHGKQIYDENFTGGYFATLHPKFHKNPLALKFKSPELGDYDVLEDVVPKAQKRGLKVYVFMADNMNHKLPGVDELLELGLDGKHTEEVCMNNETYAEIIRGLMEDCLKSYPVDGLLYRSERLGPLSKSLGLTHQGFSQPVCFCKFCTEKSKKAGIPIEKAKIGYTALMKFVEQSKKGIRPNDGYYVEFWRLLLKHPALLEWQQFQYDSMLDTYKRVYDQVKAYRPNLPIGWAIPMNHNINPLYRANVNWGQFAPFSDFLKVLAYNNVDGPRMVQMMNNGVKTLYGDMNPEQLLDFHYQVLGYQERGLGQIAYTGFSANFVKKETERAVNGLKGTKTKVYMGIDVEIPTNPNETKVTPVSLKAAVKAALQNGADGIFLARKYSEMNLRVLEGAGEAIKELGLNR